MAEDKKPELSPSIAKKYSLKMVTPGPFIFHGEKYDSTTMDLQTADKLFEDECPYLELINSKNPVVQPVPAK